MKVHFMPYTGKNGLVGFAAVDLDIGVTLCEIAIRLKNEMPVVCYPRRKSKKGKRYVYYFLSAEIITQITADIVDQYEQWRNKDATNA